MATVSQWTPFGVALDITATSSTVTRKSATQFTVKINVSWKTHWDGAETNYGMKAESGGSSKTINAWSNYASSGSGSFTGTYSISGNGSATKSITVKFTNWEEDWDGDVTATASKSITLSVSVPAWTSYTVKYNANYSGGVAPGSQTQWKDQAITLAGAISRTGYTFHSWNTAANGSGTRYNAGASYKANANVTLYAQWTAHTYTITYDGNGGTVGSVKSQTKTYGVNLTLTGTASRTNYTFLGWNENKSATSGKYSTGSAFSTNANTTLYAIWSLNYVKPRISSFSVSRCDVSGTATDSGTYAKVTFTWATDRTVSSIKVTWTSTSGGSGSATISESGTGKTTSEIIGGSFSTDSAYSMTLTVTDNNGSSSAYVTLPGTAYAIDITEDGTGIAIGKPAEHNNRFEVAHQSQFHKDVFGMVFGFGYLPPVTENSDFNDYIVPGGYSVASNAIAKNMANKPCDYAGRLYVMTGTGAAADRIYGTYAYIVQLYITYNAHMYIRDMSTGSTAGAWTCYDWKTII